MDSFLALSRAVLEVERLREELKASEEERCKMADTALAEVTRLLASNDELLEALTWYADGTNWRNRQGMLVSNNVLDDNGERARAAIARAKGEQP